MDYQQVIQEQLLPGLLTLIALVVSFYLKQALAKWAALAEGDTISGKAYRLALAAYQLNKNSKQAEAAKEKMLCWAVSMLQEAFPKLTDAQARAEIEAAVREAKSQGALPSTQPVE
jgi:hypothetical protein